MTSTTTTVPIAAADPRRQGRPKRRLFQLLIAAVAVFGAVGLMAAPASAAQTCTGGTNNLCLSINRLADGRYLVHVGIDVRMSLDAAQEYIDDVGDPFTVTIHGDDDGDLGDSRFTLTQTGLSASADFGLSGDFEKIVPGFFLDEDNGTDEVRALVKLTDTDVDRSIFFRSNLIVGNF
jgi:hypothetical protein